MQHRSYLIGVGVLCASIATHVIAQEDVTLDRYVTIKTTPTLEQKNVLMQIIDIQVPESIETVGAAIDYLLKPTGFTLAGKHD